MGLGWYPLPGIGPGLHSVIPILFSGWELWGNPVLLGLGAREGL